jgi:hypothetical protein
MHPCTLTETELAYMAGFVDGDGSVTLKKGYERRNKTPVLLFTNTSPTIMNWLEQRLPPVNLVRYTRTVLNRAPAHWLGVHGLTHRPLYEALLPYLVIKKPQMELLLEWIQLRLSSTKHNLTSARQQLLERMLAFMNLKPSRVLEDEKLKIYRSTTWELTPEHTKLLGSSFTTAVAP